MMNGNRRQAQKPIPPDPTRPEGWLAIHRGHGGRVFYEVKIGEWHRWRCSCGDKFTFNDAQREAAPKRFTLEGGSG